MITNEAIEIMKFLLPGFFIQSFVSAMHVTESVDKLRFVIKAMIYTFIVQYASQIMLSLPIISAMESNILHTATVIAISIIIAIAHCYAIRYDYMRFLRNINITERSSRATTWDDVFSSGMGYATISLQSGYKIRGIINNFSNDKQEGIVALTSAVKIANGAVTKYDAELVVIPNIQHIDVIELDSRPFSYRRTAKRRKPYRPRARSHPFEILQVAP